jgi:ABC-2 type transport system permease protein
MNIYKHEMRAGWKPFLFWMIGMFMLCFVGIIKYQSYTESGSMMDLLSSFPRIVLAIMGVVGVDISRLSGYTALLFYYVLICAVIYAVHLGAAAVSRESIDKTYEFVFAKPCSRTRVLGLKLASAFSYLFLFCVMNAVFSLLAVSYINSSEKIGRMVFLFSLTVFLIGALFIALSAFFAASAGQPDKGTLYGNLAFLYAFILGVVYNMMENPGILKLITPFNYYSPTDLVAERLDPVYTVITLAFSALFLYLAIDRFNRKDLT